MTATSPSAPLSPLDFQHSPVAWVRKNLFNNWFNSLLTLVLGSLILWVAYSFLNWAFTLAQWQVIPANMSLYLVGRYPSDHYWRLWVLLSMISLLSGLTWGLWSRHVSMLFSRGALIGLGLAAVLAILAPTTASYRLLIVGIVLLCAFGAWVGRWLAQQLKTLGRWISLAWFLSFFVTLWLMLGGLGLSRVSTNDWGGLMLTLFMSVISIVLSFPFGVILALGRQSMLPVIRWLSTIYIELIRGVPLISILFMGQVMIPLFLPEGMRPDRVLRAIVGLTLFTAAYLAENVRAGLQAVPRGQLEAARSLGLNAPLTLSLIVLPQAIKIAIPAIVGQFISLFQDTTLVSIVGLLELLGISRSILANPEFLGRYGEVYLFIGLIYWFFCYAMSVGSRKLEEKLNTER